MRAETAKRRAGSDNTARAIEGHMTPHEPTVTHDPKPTSISWLGHATLLALAAFGLIVVIMIIANAKEPYGGPLEA